MQTSHNLPLVSCICPTMESRKQFLRRAIQCFESQDYPNKELVIVADGPWIDEMDLPLPGASHGARVIISAHLDVSLGAKRNFACHLACGEIICHFDDDDWSGPSRISRQVDELMKSSCAVSGFRSALARETRTVRVYGSSEEKSPWWTLTAPDDSVLGASLCYRRSWWENERHIFPAHLNVGEDNVFIAEAAAAGQLFGTEGNEDFVLTNHAGSISGRVINIADAASWKNLPASYQGPSGYFL